MIDTQQNTDEAANRANTKAQHIDEVSRATPQEPMPTLRVLALPGQGAAANRPTRQAQEEAGHPTPCGVRSAVASKLNNPP